MWRGWSEGRIEQQTAMKGYQQVMPITTNHASTAEVPPQWEGFLSRFGLKTDMDFEHFDSN